MTVAREPSGIITLLTDFGTADPFVGVMKGVILARFSRAVVVDLCHEILPQDVAQGAFWLSRSYRWFSPGTVHLAVVDPGVGSDRDPIAFAFDDHWFVMPDNGLADATIGRRSSIEARRIRFEALGLPQPSRTFHGRDVFAPAAAELASGRIGLEALGDAMELRPRLEREPPRAAPSHIEGEVISVDHFGNLISDIDAELMNSFDAPVVSIGDRTLRVVGTYADAEVGACVALVGSFGTLEVAVRDGNASRTLGLGRGAPLFVRGR